jgi:tRNA threonylcarbamoyladenosine biosynthesis protein TsaE
VTLLKEYVSKSENETQDIAKILSEHIKINSIVYIEGALGAGKTFFANSLAKNFGISDICSSTYSFVSTYSGKLNLIHCDLYRYSRTPSIIIEEIFEHLKEPWLLIIEWPNFEIPLDCNGSYLVNITTSSYDKRIINITTLIN